jgi:hypothetical protein
LVFGDAPDVGTSTASSAIEDLLHATGREAQLHGRPSDGEAALLYQHPNGLVSVGLQSIRGLECRLVGGIRRPETLERAPLLGHDRAHRRSVVHLLEMSGPEPR